MNLRDRRKGWRLLLAATVVSSSSVGVGCAKQAEQREPRQAQRDCGGRDTFGPDTVVDLALIFDVGTEREQVADAAQVLATGDAAESAEDDVLDLIDSVDVDYSSPAILVALGCGAPDDAVAEVAAIAQHLDGVREIRRNVSLRELR